MVKETHARRMYILILTMLIYIFKNNSATTYVRK